MVKTQGKPYTVEKLILISLFSQSAVKEFRTFWAPGWMLASLGRSKPFRVYRPRGMLAEANFRYTTILAGFTN